MSDICPFCNLRDRVILAENSNAIAFADGFAISLGHALIIPKRHIADVFELSAAEMIDCFDLLKIVKSQLDEKFKPDAYNVGVNSGLDAGQTILHVHWHLIPRYKGDVDDPRGGIRWILKDKARYWT